MRKLSFFMAAAKQIWIFLRFSKSMVIPPGVGGRVGLDIRLILRPGHVSIHP